MERFVWQPPEVSSEDFNVDEHLARQGDKNAWQRYMSKGGRPRKHWLRRAWRLEEKQRQEKL